MKNSTLFETLQSLNLTSLETRELFNSRTRDVANLNVWRDRVSGVIYIEEYYTGEQTYIDGRYVKEHVLLQSGSASFEENTDAVRRFDSNLRFVSGKKVLDFGCGNGRFLRLINEHCGLVAGVEIQSDYVDALNSDSITCVTSLEDIDDMSFDVCVSFHVLEHLPDPVEVLRKIKNKLTNGGRLIVEVPHANDFLLSTIKNEPFKQFTLWSQHLLLHTRESLRRMLTYAGFENIEIQGVQRYPLSNHLNWLANGKPAGHKSSLGLIDSDALECAYEESLARIDATDTLVATATVP